LKKIGGMLGMKYRSVAELERYFIDELTRKKEMQKIAARVERDLRKIALLG